jgi:chitinase
MFLLENPDLVHTDAYTVFTSALWFYMTPQSPKPSIHDVMTGFMIPTDADI